MRDFVRDASSERIKTLLDNRVPVVTAMALLSLHLSMDIFVPRHTSESGYFTVVKLILGALAVMVLGNMLLKSKVKEQQVSSDIVKAAFEVKAVNTVSGSSDEVMGAVTSESARKQWDNGVESVSKESESQVTVKYAGGY